MGKKLKWHQPFSNDSQWQLSSWSSCSAPLGICLCSNNCNHHHLSTRQTPWRRCQANTYTHRHTLAHCRRCLCLCWCTETTEATARTNVLKWRRRRRRKKERKWRWKWRPKVQRVYKSSSRQSSRACSHSFSAASFGYCTVVYFWLFIIVADVFHWLALLSAAKHSVKLYFKTPTYLIVSVFFTAFSSNCFKTFMF